ncbi:MAG TPA: MarR family transcriptional regulator [Streptosporangiaceae bacterium]
MPPPARTPIGLVLARTARTASRAFDEALAAAGGSLPVWLILLTLKTRQLGNQRELAEAVGIRGATLTHHLNAMEAGGLVARRRDPANRRIQHVELTPAGEALFRQLAGAALAFDQRLRAGLDDRDLDVLDELLGRLHANINDGPAAGAAQGTAR